nr:EAL domain-containing protein [Micromonospora sp. DSM 115978]
TAVKIDGQVLAQADTKPEDAAIVDAIVRIARTLGIYTVAEGVDRERLGVSLRDLGVDFAQGYHFGRPQPLEDLVGELAGIAAGPVPPAAAVAAPAADPAAVVPDSAAGSAFAMPQAASMPRQPEPDVPPLVNLPPVPEPTPVGGPGPETAAAPDSTAYPPYTSA